MTGGRGKQLELLKEAFPEIRRVSFIADDSLDDHPLRGGGRKWTDFTSAAEVLGMDVRVLNVPTIEAVEDAFDSVAWEATDGLYQPGSSPLYAGRARAMTQAAKYRLRVMWTRREYALEGGLMAYGFYVPDYFSARCSTCTVS